jgi:hypothetical protein
MTLPGESFRRFRKAFHARARNHRETRTVRLSQITGMDLAIMYWGSPWMAHPIVSFRFAGALPLCFSIETRKAIGQQYSAVRGLYRQYTLIYIVADERDFIRVRSNYRQGEDVRVLGRKRRCMVVSTSLHARNSSSHWPPTAGP